MSYAAATKGAFSSSHDENAIVDFDQILSDLCDLENQLIEQSNLNDTSVVPEFSHQPSPSPPLRHTSNSTIIFKDYTQLKSNSSKTVVGDTTTPHKSDQTQPSKVDTDLNFALLELSALVGSGFNFDENNQSQPNAADCRQGYVSSDLKNDPRNDLPQSNQFHQDSNGTNNNVHTRSKSMENGLHPQKGSAILNSRVLQSNWKEHVSDSGQNDSAFDDSVSLPSSGSRISVATSSRSSGSSITNSVSALPNEVDESKKSQDASKAALDRNNQSNLNKIFIRVYSSEGSSENVMVTERMTVSHVIDNLLTNNHAEPNLSWSLVEQLPGLYMERLLEDNECLTDNVQTWTNDSENRFVLVERPDKYDIFVYPEKYLATIEDKHKKCDDTIRQAFIQEFLESNCRLPEFDGMLYIKLEGKKAWKKLYFTLRASGIYYNPKGKSKSLIDLVCLQKLDLVEVHTGIGWRKKYKAPNDFGFALKHLQIQKKAPKYIKYFCAEDADSMWRWINSVRLAKYGQQLHNNFLQRQNIIRQFFGEDPVARLKQTALIQEKISEMFSQQVESVSSFSCAAELSPSLMQTFRAESPDSFSSSRLLKSCVDENEKTPAKMISKISVTTELTRQFSGGQIKSPKKIIPPKSPKKFMTESVSVHQLPPHPLVPIDSADSWRDSGFPDSTGHEFLCGSVDQLQNVGSPAFGRLANQKTSKMVAGGKWATTSRKHAVIKRTPSIGHRDVEEPPPLYPPMGPVSPKPLPSPKPSLYCTTNASISSAALPSPSSLPPIRRNFPSSTSFSDSDDGRISLTPHASPKPKPPLPPKRKDIMKQSVSVDSSPVRGRTFPLAGNLTLPKKPQMKSRPSSAMSQQSMSPPQCSSPVSFAMQRSPSCESWQHSNFLMDLERVILLKQTLGSQFAKDAKALSRGASDVDIDSLPPPPAALLEGLKRSGRPPPPPKRSNETQLTYK